MSSIITSATSPPDTPSTHNGVSSPNQHEMVVAQLPCSSSKRVPATTTNSGRSAEIRSPADKGCSGPLKRHSKDGETKSATPPPTKQTWRDQPHVGKYKLIRTLGRGNFAKVKLAQHITTKKEVAVKLIDKGQLNEASLNKLFREVSVMKQLNHPNIVKLYEVIETERHVYLVMEFASNGELFEYLVSNGRMRENEARIKFRQIVSAVQYCHQKNIVHRDLKAENLLLDANYNIKLADFGFSNTFNTNKKLDTFCGSPPYAAPELFKGQKYVGPEVDVWSLGVILYTIVSGYLPFDASNLRDLRERVLRGKYRVPFFMSTDCELLLKRMLVLAPEKRNSLLAVMEDKWTNSGMGDNILQPYVEPVENFNDPVRLAAMVELGFTLDEIKDSLVNHRFNNVTATYLILGDDSAASHALQSSSRPVLNTTDSASIIQGDEMDVPEASEVLIDPTGKSILSNSNSNTAHKKKTPTTQTWLKRNVNSSDVGNSIALTKEVSKKTQRTTFGGRNQASVDSQSQKNSDESNVKRPTFALPSGEIEPEKVNVDVPSKEPLKGGVRRTHTFTSPSTGAEKRRNTVAGPRNGLKGTTDAADVDAMGNALVRAQNMDNIVDQLEEENVGEGTNDSTPTSPKSHLRSTDDYCEETPITPANHAIILQSSTDQPSSELKRYDSFWKRMRRSMTKKKRSTHLFDNDLVTDTSPTTSGFSRDTSDRRTMSSRAYHTTKDFPTAAETVKPDNELSGGCGDMMAVGHIGPQDPSDVGATVPRYRPVSKSGDDNSQLPPPNPDEAAALLQYSKRYRHRVQLDSESKEVTIDQISPPVVVPETPVEIASYPTNYSNTSFFRNLTSRISRSFRRKRHPPGQKHSTGPLTVESGVRESPLRGRLAPIPPTNTGNSKKNANLETADPWSPMLVKKQAASSSHEDGEHILPEDNEQAGPTRSDSLHSLGPLLPSCWGRKPRKISFPRKSRLTGSDPDRLVSELIAALTISRLHFVRLGEYRLQFVFSIVSAIPTGDTFTPLAKIIHERDDFDKDLFERDLRVAIEVYQFLATNTYAVRFKHLSGEMRAYKLVTDSIAKLIKSSTA